MNNNKNYFLFYDDELWNCNHYPQFPNIIVNGQNKIMQNANTFGTERPGVQIPVLILITTTWTSLSLISFVFKMMITFPNHCDFCLSKCKKALNKHEFIFYSNTQRQYILLSTVCLVKLLFFSLRILHGLYLFKWILTVLPLVSADPVYGFSWDEWNDSHLCHLFLTFLKSNMVIGLIGDGRGHE